MRKRIVIDWIRNIGRCPDCDNEQLAGLGFYITNANAKDWCNKCQKYVNFIIVGHEVRLLEEIKDMYWNDSSKQTIKSEENA